MLHKATNQYVGDTLRLGFITTFLEFQELKWNFFQVEQQHYSFFQADQEPYLFTLISRLKMSSSEVQGLRLYVQISPVLEFKD
jgi:hypothetical protein